MNAMVADPLGGGMVTTSFVEAAGVGILRLVENT
jgi:hypothetical protein